MTPNMPHVISCAESRVYVEHTSLSPSLRGISRQFMPVRLPLPVPGPDRFPVKIHGSASDRRKNRKLLHAGPAHRS